MNSYSGSGGLAEASVVNHYYSGKPKHKGKKMACKKKKSSGKGKK